VESRFEKGAGPLLKSSIGGSRDGEEAALTQLNICHKSDYRAVARDALII
jgi:hypothetical protein